MIACGSLRGNMGNQMFTIATTIAHALRMNTTYAIPRRSGKRNQFPMMFDHLNGKLQIDVDHYAYCREDVFGVYSPIPLKDNLHLMGYFQSEKYFKDYRKEVIEAFQIPKFEFKPDTVAVHVRRGDYLRLSHKHNVLTFNWIRFAMQNICYTMRKQLKFIFFSDDITWCKEHFASSKNLIFAEYSDPKIAMGHISSCEHSIMSASSFSWCGNWIADNNGKGRIVIAPKDWFNPSYQKLRSDDIVPENWVRL
jgi:hypothetical protein